jgi:hypothetical protein
LALDLGLDIQRPVARAYPPRVACNHVFADLLVALGRPDRVLSSSSGANPAPPIAR